MSYAVDLLLSMVTLAVAMLSYGLGRPVVETIAWFGCSIAFCAMARIDKLETRMDKLERRK